MTLFRLLVILTMSTAWSDIGMGLTADDILRKADNIRNPTDSFVMDVTVNDSSDGIWQYKISMGGKNRSLIKTIQPKRDIGKNFLMLEQEMWVYIPNIRRALRVALNQKMAGQFANGDIGRMRWHGNYKAKVVAQEKKEWILALNAKKTGLTYEAMKVWIDKKSYRPIKAEYLTRGGKVIKTVKISDYRKMAGTLRPTKFTIVSAENKSKTSTLIVNSMVKTRFPSTHFTRQALK